MQDVSYTPDALRVATRLYEAEDDPTYDRLLDVLDRIAEDPEEAKHARWTEYVSSRQVYGTKVPGGDWTVFWKTTSRGVLVVLLIEDMGI